MRFDLLFILFASTIFLSTSLSACPPSSININYKLQWTADDIIDHESGHGFITRQGITIVKNERDNGPLQNLLFDKIDFIAQKSVEPDSYENNFYTFAGHFYDPDTGKNWRGSTTNTALTNMTRHALDAVRFFKEHPSAITDSNEAEVGLKSLAYALHYLEDSCVPHHAANYIAFLSWHTQFEGYAQLIQEKFSIDRSIHPYLDRKGDFVDDIKEILTKCAQYAKPFAYQTDLVDSNYADVYVNSRCYQGTSSLGAPDCDIWDEVIEKTKRETQSRVAQFIDRFIKEISKTL